MRAQTAAAILAALCLSACAPGHDRQLGDNMDATPPEIGVTADAAVAAGTRSAASIESAQGQASMRDFAADYAKRGNGPVEVRGSADGVRSAAAALLRAGVRLDDLRLKVTGDTGSSVMVAFAAFRAVAPDCTVPADALQMLAGPALQRSDFGCATQHDLALMVSDPSDLVRRRGTPYGSNAEYATGLVRSQRTFTTYDKPSVSEGK
jgi:pilus assembly protein CpaD